jgi:hypothetical protein
MKLSDKDFKYYKHCVDTDRKEHSEGMKKYNCPEDVLEAYNGKFGDGDESMVENYLFVGASTIIPTLFYQLPRVNIRAKRSTMDFEASVLTSLINSDLSDQEKEENQLAIIDAFLPYGYAVVKNGYNSRTAPAAKKPSMLTGKAEAPSDKDNDMEGDNEYIVYERPITIRQSPKKTYLDSSQPFGKGNRITFEYERTLQQLIDSNLYDLSTNFISYYGSRGTDNRKVDLELVEHWTIIDGYAWKLCYIEGWQDPIKWVKTKYRWLPVSYLRFNKVGDILYSVSHGTLGLRSQKELNYLNELWKKHIDSIRNQQLIWEEALTESGKKTIKQNDIGGIITTTKPVSAGVAMSLTSSSVDPALFGNIQSTREFLKLIMSSTGGKMGGDDSELATVEKNKSIGDAMRTSGMQDAIRDFMIDQIKQRIKNYLVFGTPERIVKLTGENLIGPISGETIEPGSELKLGGEDGMTLEDIISGDIDVDYLFDVDIQSAARPDYPVIRKQLADGISLASSLMPILQAAGKTANIDLMIKDYFKTFDAIPDSDKYISDAKPMPSPMAAPDIGAGSPGVPEEGAIAAGAGRVDPGVGGLT